MNAPRVTHDNLPEAVADLHRKIDQLLSQRQPQPEADKLLTLDELRDYLPEHPARQTIYGWVNNRLVPFEKYGKRLYFRKSVIENWLAKGRQS